MDKIAIRMSYTGDKIEGQGVGSATKEQIDLIKTMCHIDFYVKENKGKYDIFHAHTINPRNYFGAKYSKKPVITHVHFLPETFEGSIKVPKPFMKLFNKYFLKIYKKSDYLVVVNPTFIKDLEAYGAKKERIKYIPNFVSEESFYQQDSENKNTTREKYGIKPDEFVVLGVGQVQTRKGVMDFIEIASKMPHIKFVWAGGFTFGVISDGYKELKKAVETAPENVIFTDIIPRNQMNDMYNMADILFMPSYNELFPMAILESCSVGTPLLLRDLELYENILFNAYVKGSNNEEFISLIEELATKKEMYDQALVNANKIKTYYSRENIKKEWTNFYKEVHQEYVDNNYKRISKLKRK